MKTVYFNVHDGSPLTENITAGEEALNQNKAFKAEVQDNISSWRLKYDIITRQVIVYGGVEKNEEQAIQQKMEEDRIKSEQENEQKEILRKENEKREYLLRVARRNLLNSQS